MLEVTKRQAENALCVLLGIPPIDLCRCSGPDRFRLLRRRWCWESPKPICCAVLTDVLQSRATRWPSEQIGIAEADLIPCVLHQRFGSATSSEPLPHLFRYSAFTGSVGPCFNGMCELWLH